MAVVAGICSACTSELLQHSWWHLPLIMHLLNIMFFTHAGHQTPQTSWPPDYFDYTLAVVAC